MIILINYKLKFSTWGRMAHQWLFNYLTFIAADLTMAKTNPNLESQLKR